MHSQPHSRRVHLATVDFLSLGVEDLHNVEDLTYDTEDRPHHVDYTKALGWLEIAQTASTHGNDLLIPALDNLLSTSTHHVTAIEEPSADDELSSLRRQLEAVRDVEAIQQRMVDSLDGVRTIRFQIEQAIRMKEAPTESFDLEESYLREQRMAEYDHHY